MTRTSRIIAFASLAATALAATALTPVIAEAASTATGDQVTTASRSGAANPELQISNDGFNVMRDIRAARIAIFNGDTSAAQNYVTEAKADMVKARADGTAQVKKDTGKQSGAWIAIDGQLLVSDNFVASPEKAAGLHTSNVALKGDAETAVQALEDADVDVGFTRVLMPLNQTSKHIDTALSLIGEHKYYEANLALKAAEDGLGVDTVMLFSAAPPNSASGVTTSSGT